MHIPPAETPKNNSHTIQQREKGDTNNAETWPVYQDLLEGSIIFAVMGATGSGKSNFIKLTGAKRKTLSSQKAQKPIVGHTIEYGNSQDTEIQDVQVYELYHNTRRILLVDTPGFDDSPKCYAEILELLASWLSTSYYFKQAPVGFIYLQPINDSRINDSTPRRLDLFHRLCGSKAMKTVTLITTMWDKDFLQEEQYYVKREIFLKRRWAKMTKQEVVALRSYNRKTDTPSLIDRILRQSSPVELSVQVQLVEDEISLAFTDIGCELMTNISSLHRDLSRESQSVRKIQLDRQAKGQGYDDLEARLAELEAEIKAGYRVRKRLKTWTFESVLSSIANAALGGAGVDGARYGICLGALAIRLTPGIAVAIAGAGMSSVIRGLLDLAEVRKSPWPPSTKPASPKDTMDMATKMMNLSDQTITSESSLRKTSPRFTDCFRVPNC